MDGFDALYKAQDYEDTCIRWQYEDVNQQALMLDDNVKVNQDERTNQQPDA